MPDDTTDAVAQLVQSASHDAARQIYQRLTGALWHHEQAAGDATDKQALADERDTLRAQWRALVPGSPEVATTLTEWGSRVRQLEQL